MKFYILSHSSEKKEVGDFPQTVSTEVPDSSGEFELSSRANLTNDKFPIVEPVLDFELTKKAKLTDVISASNIQARGLLMNAKVKNQIEGFNIMTHKFYSGFVNARGNKIPYFWIHIVNNSYEGIDFEKSKFIEIGFTGRKVDDADINSLEEFINISNIKMIDAERLVFRKDSFVNYLDLFFFPNVNHSLIASEKLVKALIADNISGIKIKNAEFIL